MGAHLSEHSWTNFVRCLEGALEVVQHEVWERSALQWLGVLAGVLAGLGLLRRLWRTRANRIPHPNKTVGDGEPEVIIVGGGVMGSSLAAALGMDGRRVTVIERDMTEPDRVVGEFLQPGGVAVLKELLLEDCLEGIDSPHVRGYVLRNLFSGDIIKLPTPVEKVSPRSFHHGRFVQQLRKSAMNNQTVRYLEGVALGVIEEAGAVAGVRYRLKGSDDEQVLRAPLVVVADGISSKLRQAYTKDSPVTFSSYCSIKVYDAEPQKYNVLMSAGPVMIISYPLSSNCTRVVVDYPKKPTDWKSQLINDIYPKIPADLGLAPAFLKAVEADQLSCRNINWMPANPVIKPGLVLLGDALNIRHPSTAGGLSIALNDALLTRNMLRKLPDLYDYNIVVKLYSQLLVARKNKSFSTNVFSLAVPALSISKDDHVKRFTKGFLKYFAKDGFRKNGFIGIMSGLSPQPRFLVMHLTLAMLYSFGDNFKEQGLLMFPVAVYQGCCMFVKSCGVIAPYIWAEIKVFF